MASSSVFSVSFFYCGPAQLTTEQCSSLVVKVTSLIYVLLHFVAPRGNKNKAMITSGRSMIWKLFFPCYENEFSTIWRILQHDTSPCTWTFGNFQQKKTCKVQCLQFLQICSSKFGLANSAPKCLSHVHLAFCQMYCWESDMINSFFFEIHWICKKNVLSSSLLNFPEVNYSYFLCKWYQVIWRGSRIIEKSSRRLPGWFHLDESFRLTAILNQPKSST